ncbi:MAG: hypothetical protein K2X37_09555 [Chitinophagaceae bacterium]|nr:hypothetical protein [Chitinophagaceae bacterium]
MASLFYLLRSYCKYEVAIKYLQIKKPIYAAGQFTFCRERGIAFGDPGEG